MPSTSAYIEIHLTQFGETFEHEDGIEVYDEGTILVALTGEEGRSVVAFDPSTAIMLAKQLMAAGIAGAKAQRRSQKEMKNG